MKSELNISNLADYLSLHSRERPDSPALLHPVKKSFREMDCDADKYASGLLEKGVRKGDMVLIMIPMSYNFFVLTFALVRIGAILVMIDPGMGLKAMARALKGIPVDVFIGVYKAHLFRMLYPRSFAETRLNIYTDFNPPGSGSGLIDIYSETTNKLKCAAISEDETVGVLFTSGSTGAPKGVVYTKSMFVAQINCLRDYFTYFPGEVDLCTFPLIGFFSLCLGLSTVISDMNHGKPKTSKPEKLLQNITEYQVTHMFCSPLIIKKLTSYISQNKPIISDSLKTVITAGAPVSPELLENFKAIISETTDVFTPYGATEALPITSISSDELLAYYEKNGEPEIGVLVGRALNKLTIKIIRITDNPIPNIQDAEFLSNEIGEIIVKGPVVSKEYYNNDSNNKKSKIIDPEIGEIWHRMGDLGLIDAEERIFYYGRKSHRVCTESSTLFTIPCERIFNSHPDVSRSALVGIDRHGEDYKEPVICIQLKRKSRMRSLAAIEKELLQIASKHKISSEIKTVLFKRRFPVDPRHNAKIFREKLALWARNKIK